MLNGLYARTIDNGSSIRLLTSLPTARVLRSLNQLIEWRGIPIAIRCDNGSEFTSHEFVKWAEKNNIRIEYIQSGNPQQNGCGAITMSNRTKLIMSSHH